MKQKKAFLLCMLVGIAAALCIGIGCDAPATKGVLTLNLTDAPSNYEEVFITFTQIAVHRAENGDNATTDNATDDNATDNESLAALFKNGGRGGNKDDAEDNETDNGTGNNRWVVISAEEQGFNLVTLQNGRFDLLAQAELDSGKYTQIRLKITDAYDNNSEPKTYVKVDGVKYPLFVPSGAKSGLKITHPFIITPDNETVLYLDFDAEKSVNQTGSGMYKLQPTIKILTEPPLQK